MDMEGVYIRGAYDRVHKIAESLDYTNVYPDLYASYCKMQELYVDYTNPDHQTKSSPKFHQAIKEFFHLLMIATRSK